MPDREKVIRIIDELIFEAQKAPTWKAENALRCLKKELLKEQEAVEPRVSTAEQRCGHCNKVIEMDGWKACPWCGKRINWESWWRKNEHRQA